MPENIVAGLFGISPSQIQQQQQAAEEARALQFAQLSPFERANMGMYQAGGQIARAGMGMLGMQDEATRQARQAQEIQSQIDHSTPEGLLQGAQLFNQAGNARMAAMYSQAAQAKQAELANLRLKEAQTEKERALAQKAGKEEDMTKYGRLQKVEVGVEGKPDYRQQALYDPLSGEVKLIGAPYRVTAAITAEARQTAAETKAEAKKASDLPQARLRTDSIIQNLDDLSSRLGELATHPGLPNITGTIYGRTPSITQAANDAQAKLDTIKSKVFVSALQAMREVSKTGGAVGNVSDKEGDKLENTLAALKQAQRTAAFKDELARAQRELANSKVLIQRAFNEQFGETNAPSGKPAGMKRIGKTPDGRDVYQDATGKNWVQ